MPRDSFYCSSKCGSPKGDELRQSLERSLTRLNVSTIDFFHIWCLLKPEQLAQRVAGGAIPAAIKAREEGLIRHLVVSAHLDGQGIEHALEAGYFEGITLGYNVLNFPFRAQGLAAAQRLHMGVVTMNPLGGGMIPKQAQRLAFIQGPQDTSVVQAALRFNVSHSAITCALVGMGSIEEVDQAVEAVDQFQPYPADHIEMIKSRIGKEFDVLHRLRLLACHARPTST
ncbi:MAG: aldo/keto reductase, partial [Phycisphaerales bacterium]|nr:aldo/keto reductase [Phycisphaerales bacterium]